jgi:hypothetical protein
MIPESAFLGNAGSGFFYPSRTCFILKKSGGVFANAEALKHYLKLLQFLLAILELT